MKHFTAYIFLFTIFIVLPSRADDILVSEKGAEPTVYASEVFVYGVDKDNQGKIYRIDYVSWNAKDMSIQYKSAHNYTGDAHSLHGYKTYSLRESGQEKKQEILQMLSAKSVAADIYHDQSKITKLSCLMFDYSLPGYAVLGRGVPDDAYISLIESSGTIHLFPLKVIESLFHYGDGKINVKLGDGHEYKGIWERRSYVLTGHVWTIKLQGLTEKGEFRRFSLSDISSIKFPPVKEQVKVSVAATDEPAELTEQVKKYVIELGYTDETAEDLINMAHIWKDAQGHPALSAWKVKITNEQEKYRLDKISEAQFAQVEESIIKELFQKIRNEVSYNEKYFDLVDIAKNKQAQCLGYSQLFYILGNSLNLSVRPISVLELYSSEPLPSKLSHVACIVSLADGKSIMVDLVPGGFVSRPFIIEKEFIKVGNYRELKNDKNPLTIHRRIQIQDKNGLISYICNNRGTLYSDLGQFTQAISEYNKAIELNPKYAGAYNNRGGAYSDLGQFKEAISERTKAIELDPKFDRAYYNRGLAYYNSGKVSKAVSDYNKAIKLNPKLTEAYNNRGVAYGSSGQLKKAVSDYTKAIELDPEHIEAYKNRGLAYLKLKEFHRCISDYNKAIKLNPGHVEAYNNRGTAYGQLGRFTKAISDYNKAINLDPKYAKAYYHRGLAQVFLKNFEEAKKDLQKAVKLDPSLKKAVNNISNNFKLNLHLD